MSAFSEISIILAVTFGLSILMRILRQPLIIGYIISGIILGPYILNVIHNVELMELLSKIGITALLFIVGLGLSPKVLKETGLAAGSTGFGQILGTSLITYYFSTLVLGLPSLEGFYLSIAFGFSSTIIILKLLNDKGDTHKLYGRIAIGFLLVEDLVATIVLVMLAGIGTQTDANISQIIYNLGYLLGLGLILLIGLFIFTTQVLSRLTNFISRSQEFLFIFSLAWGLTIAYLYQRVGLSIEIGALVAGVSLSMTPYAVEISSRLKPLRDFFILMFFILLGSHMSFGNINNLIGPALMLSVLIIIFKPFFIYMIMNLLGYTRKNGFLAGLVVAQISEFSLILVKLGNDLGHVSDNTMSLVTLVAVFTIAISTYMVMNGEYLYKKFGRFAALFEIRKNIKLDKKISKEYEGAIFGFNRAGPEFAKVLTKEGIKYIVVDFNPEVFKKLEKEGVKVEYGDASDVEFLEELPLQNLKIAISTINDFETNQLLTHTLRKANKDMAIFVTAESKQEANKLYNLGASHVVLSHYVGAKHASLMISKLGMEDKNYDKYKLRHLKELE